MSCAGTRIKHISYTDGERDNILNFEHTYEIDES